MKVAQSVIFSLIFVTAVQITDAINTLSIIDYQSVKDLNTKYQLPEGILARFVSAIKQDNSQLAQIITEALTGDDMLMDFEDALYDTSITIYSASHKTEVTTLYQFAQSRNATKILTFFEKLKHRVMLSPSCSSLVKYAYLRNLIIDAIEEPIPTKTFKDLVEQIDNNLLYQVLASNYIYYKHGHYISWAAHHALKEEKLAIAQQIQQFLIWHQQQVRIAYFH